MGKLLSLLLWILNSALYNSVDNRKKICNFEQEAYMKALWYFDNLFVKLRVKKYKRKYPNEKILFAGISKALSRAFEKEVKAGSDYIDAKKTAFLLTDRNIAAREWRIGIGEITRAELDTYNSLYGKAMLLKIKARDGGNYQFGMRYDEKFFKQNVLRFEHREIEHVYPTWFKLTHHILMPIWRLLIIGLIIYGLIRLFRWIGS